MSLATNFFRNELPSTVVNVLGGDVARVDGDVQALARNRAGAEDVVLTARETQVLAFIGRGMASKAIAERLSISPRTAEAHRAKLMLKLGARTQAALVGQAVARGLVDPGST